MVEQIFSVGEFAKMLGVHVRTLQAWDRRGKLVSRRSPTGRRFYTEEQYRELMGEKSRSVCRRRVCYTRILSAGQKADLKNQIAAMEQFVAASGKPVDAWMSDIGSGLNYERKNFVRRMGEVENGEICEIFIAHQDRLVRFGFEWFERFCANHNTAITVVNLASLSPEEEVTKDLLTIIHCFSSRLYGLRRYKKQIAQWVEGAETNQ